MLSNMLPAGSFGLAAVLFVFGAFVAYEIKLRRDAAKLYLQADANGFVVLTPLITTLGSAALSAILGGLRDTANITASLGAAAISAAPGMLAAIGSSPLWAFLFGAVVFMPAGMVTGSHLRYSGDAAAISAAIRERAPGVPIRGNIRKDLAAFTSDVVKTANKRADEAIASAVKAANERADAAIAKATAKPATPATAPKKAK